MYRQAINLIIATISFTACTSPGRLLPATPLPSPSRPETAAKVPDLSARQWTFNFHNEAHTYYSTSQTTLDSNPSDLIDGKDTISIASQFTVAIDQSQTPISISGHIDSIVLKPGSRIGTGVQKLNTPIDFSGTINLSRLVLNATTKFSTSTPQTEDHLCDSPASSLLGEIRGGIVLLPVQLQLSSMWVDTISTATCSGNRFPSSLEIIRSYQVIGERTNGNTTVLLIKRTEDIHLMGNGTQGPHRVNLEGEGTGSSNIILDPTTGTILVIEAYQELKLKITSSGESKHFTQTVKQRITPAP